MHSSTGNKLRCFSLQRIISHRVHNEHFIELDACIGKANVTRRNARFLSNYIGTEECFAGPVEVMNRKSTVDINIFCRKVCVVQTGLHIHIAYAWISDDGIGWSMAVEKFTIELVRKFKL